MGIFSRNSIFADRQFSVAGLIFVDVLTHAIMLCTIELIKFHKFNFCSYNVHVHVVDYSVSARN